MYTRVRYNAYYLEHCMRGTYEYLAYIKERNQFLCVRKCINGRRFFRAAILSVLRNKFLFERKVSTR
jgi:hypothetical protein